jgi:hypothetical protein
MKVTDIAAFPTREMSSASCTPAPKKRAAGLQPPTKPKSKKKKHRFCKRDYIKRST